MGRRDRRPFMTAPIPELGKGTFWARLSDKAFERRVPLEAMIELTYGCNLRCVHCYNPTHQAKGELTTERIRAILDQLAEEGCLSLAFTGGEIFTRSDAFEIFAYAKTKGFALTLLSNATLITPDRANRIQELAPHLVELSIYGATQDTYERVTRIPGSFTAFMTGVALLRNRQIPLLIKMPVMTLNHQEVQQARALVEGWGIRFIYCTEIFPRVDGSLEPLQYRIPPQEIVQIDRAGDHREQRHRDRNQEAECGARAGLFTCTCGKSSLAVTPYGRMNLCVSLPTPQYDLQTGTVGQGWQTLVEVVETANAAPGPAHECPRCELRSDCRQGPMNAWLETGGFEPCLPYFKELARLEKTSESSGANGDAPERPRA
jgi:radical SAM protein with 4Fe4S-binding SPASM domain